MRIRRIWAWMTLVALTAATAYGHALVLESWIQRPFQFLGMIGSGRKARIITDHFVRAGVATAGQMARVACPVGVGIQSRSVMEIAVDILAKYVDERGKLSLEN